MDYDLEHLTDPMVHLLDLPEIERAVFAGYDWGGFITRRIPAPRPPTDASL